MPNYLLKYLGCNIILVASIIILKTSTSASENNLEITKLSHVAKRSFLLKEQEFLKTKPLSDEMKSFISKYKKIDNSNFDGSNEEKVDTEHMYMIEDGDIKYKKLDTINFDRSKRENKDKEHMFVVQNGNVVPLKNFQPATILDNSPSSFTVIPLIIPITVNIRENRHSGNITVTQCPEDDSKTKTESVASETPYVREHDERIFLNKVMEDMAELIKYEKEGRSLSNEGTLCSVEGDWDSDAGGMQITISPIKNKTARSLQIKLVEHNPKPKEGFLMDEPWNVTGREPFNHSSVIVLTAISTKKKRIATFIGECRICDGIESITGNWMLGRGSKDCKDRQECHSFFSDILKKSWFRKYKGGTTLNPTSTISTTTTKS